MQIYHVLLTAMSGYGACAQAIKQHKNVYLKYQERLLQEGVVSKEQVKGISDNVLAALQVLC